MSRDVLRVGSFALLLVALTLIGILFGVAWRSSHPANRGPRLSVTVLGVGKGDCILLHAPSGKVILVDTGSAQAAPIVQEALQRRGIKTIDLLVLTSPEESRIGGVPALLGSAITVTQVWDNAVADDGAARREALEAIRRRHLPSRTVHAGDAAQVDDHTLISVLWPPGDGPAARRDPILCRVDYGQTSFVLAGAATGAAERDLLGQAGAKIACHAPCTDLVWQAASGTSRPSPELLRRAAPDIVVLSGGPDNPPSLPVLHRLGAAGAAVWRTDAQGTITLTTDGRSAPMISASGLAAQAQEEPLRP